ncbi:hypothetical protein BCR44DRAFT_1425628, partial [Catenaria anguillulae PL171]
MFEASILRESFDNSGRSARGKAGRNASTAKATPSQHARTPPHAAASAGRSAVTSAHLIRGTQAATQPKSRRAQQLVTPGYTVPSQPIGPPTTPGQQQQPRPTVQ